MKKIISILFLIIVCFSLTGCSDSDVVTEIEYSDLESLPCNYTCGRLITTDYVNNHNETIFRNTLDIKLQTPIFNQEIVTTAIVENINININNKEDK